jgi:alpha-N-acetylglucosamine transferase
MCVFFSLLVHTKLMQLAVWNLTQFDRIVYLDSDVLALENPDVLFQCSGFCAQVSKSKSEGEAFNRYVLAVCMRYLKLFFFFKRLQRSTCS